MKLINTLFIFLFFIFSCGISCQSLNLSELDQKAQEKAHELSELLKIIGSDKNDRKIRQNAKDEAMDMFQSDKDSIEVISKNTKIRKKYSIRDYFNHLEGLDQYEEVQIEWKYITTIINIEQKEDGNYYGKLRVYQIFQGQGKNGLTKYKDITEKDIEVKLDNTLIQTGSEKELSYYDLKFGSITVHRIVDDPAVIRP